MTVTTTGIDIDVLAGRAVAYALLARLLGPDPAALADPLLLDRLRTALQQSGDERALGRMAGMDVCADDPVDLRRRWIRWFDQGRVAPYECSNTPASAGGITPRLADIAGFYRAFGLGVSGDRPDHVVAELEFASVVSLAEASARSDSDGEAAEVCASAARSFLRDHLGRWLQAWAVRVAATDALAPWAPWAAVAADVVAADTADRNVVPVRAYAVLPSDASLLPDDDALPVCGGDAFE